MRKIERVLRLHHECGRSNREIAQAVRASPTTVGAYLRRARLAGLAWPPLEGMSEAALFPPLPASAVKRQEPTWSAMHRQVGRSGVALDLLRQEYRECHPDGYQYSGFCEHYRAFAPTLRVTLRQSHAPAERLFLDCSV
jgi:transposase